MQHPAFSGNWTDLGLAIPSLGESPFFVPQFSGVKDLEVLGDKLFAVVGHLSDTSYTGGSIFSRSLSVRGEWARSDSGAESAFVLSKTPGGTLLAGGTSEGIFISENCGNSWDIIYPRGSNLPYGFELTPYGHLLYGLTGRYSPYLLRSSDGSTWEWITLQGKVIMADDAPVTGAAFGPGTPPSLFVVHRKILYASKDFGLTFQPILEVGFPQGTVLANQQTPGEILVCADSLYYSSDGGVSWIGTRPPSAAGVLYAVADWERGRVAAAIRPGSDSLFATPVYSFDLADLRQSISERR
jgi:hypothetical protein